MKKTDLSGADGLHEVLCAAAPACDPETLSVLAKAIEGLQKGAADLQEFEQAWQRALLRGAPAGLAAAGLQRWLLTQLQSKPEELSERLVERALQAAGRACEVVQQAASSEDACQALERILRSTPAGMTGVLLLELPAFLERSGAEHDNWRQEMRQSLASRLRPGDYLLQQSPRSWLLCMPGLRSVAQLPLAAQALAAACGAVLTQFFGAQHATVMVGAAYAPEHGHAASALMAAARSALERAREQGDSFGLFEPGRDRVCDDPALGLEFARALQANALFLHYQPQVRLEDRQCLSVEALLRWRNAAGEWIAPPRLLAMAEQLGLLPRLSDWLIAEACRTIARLNKAGHPLRIAINLTAPDFYDADLPQRVQQLAATWGVNPAQLVIEITETILIAQPGRALKVFEALRAEGCRISLDDFGTGYSSLAYLRQMPIDEVKIDRSFVAEILHSERSAAIVRSVIALGVGMQLGVVAEGAEDPATIEWLQQAGCAVVQGYGFARPMPEKELLAWLQGR